jgi:hypothetical protein
VKDLVDIVLIQSMSSFDADELRAALSRTFKVRASHELPIELPAPPDDWGVPYRVLADSLGIATDVDLAHQSAAEFLNPILSGAVTGSIWVPATTIWQSPNG